MNNLLPRRTTAFIYGVAALFLLTVLGTAVILTSEMRDRALADSESQAVRFVSGSEAALNRSLLGVDLLLASLSEPLQTSSLATVTADASRPDVAQLMQKIVRQNLLVRYIAFLDPKGDVVATSERRGTKLVVRLPTGFLQQVLAQPASSLEISTPAVSSLTSQRVVYSHAICNWPTAITSWPLPKYSCLC